MRSQTTNRQPADEALAEQALVQRILAGEKQLYTLLMRRYNQRVYRVVRAIVRDDYEAEDVVQQAYVVAYHKLSLFRGQASFATWLTRISINEALGRLRRETRHPHVTLVENGGAAEMADSADTPEEAAYRGELAKLLEGHIDALPANLRIVFVLREVEESSTEETAALLDLSLEAVRVRLHRARKLLEERLSQAVTAAPHAFGFAGARCDRIVQGVLERLGIDSEPSL